MKVFMNVLRFLAIVFCVGLLVYIIFFNLQNNTDFFKMSLTDLITLLIAIVLSYFFTERNSNTRKRKETIEILIEKIQQKLETDVMVNICDGEDIKKVSLNKRSIDNNLNLIKNNTSQMGVNIEKDIDYVVEQFNNYIYIIDGHINDIEYLRSSKLDLERYLILMSDKLNKIRMDLY